MKIKKTTVMFDAYVLVVDCNVSSGERIANLAATLGCKVHLATSGRDALKKCREVSYDVIFITFNMPEMNGLETTLKMREMEANGQKKHIIGLFTNISDRQLVIQCIKGGMNDCLVRPLTEEILEPRLAAWGVKKIYSHINNPKTSDQNDGFGLF